MDILNKKFLDILNTAIRGEAFEDDGELSIDDWQKIMRLAEIHKVLPLIFEAVYRVPALQPQIAPFMVNLRQRVLRQVTLQTMKTSEFVMLNRKLQSAGIKPVVVKGIICRNIYPKPDYRMSSDEDVLIQAEQEEACHNAMIEFGMQTFEEDEKRLKVYEVPYHKANSPLYVELHKHLFPPESDAYGDFNQFFEGVFERTIVEEINGVSIYTMEYTDHLFYLICHAFKHFLHSGFGIRQVCDIVMYANTYGSRIDWERMLQNCKAIHADIFAAALFKIGANYLVFEPEKACYPQTWQAIEVDETAMLEDLLSSGLYGDANMSRKHSSNITLDTVAAQKQGKKKGNALVASLFPSAEKLKVRYSYLEKRPYLLPIAWCERILKYHKESNQTQDNNAVDAMKIGKQRVELMKKYGIIK